MEKVVLVTGAGGFVGQSVLRQGGFLQDLKIVPLARERAAQQVLEARKNARNVEISLLNLAWPSLQRFSASAGAGHDTDEEWQRYERWLDELVVAAAETKIRFFQIGSGIERYAKTDPPELSDPYLTYARRKEAAWRRVESTMPAESWQLLLHFVFGVGESAGRIVPSAIRACSRGEPITVSAPSRKRCWLSIDDAARGLLTAAVHSQPEHWDICGSNPVSFDQLFELIGEATGRTASIAATENVVADANCPLVAPVNPAPFIRKGAGEPNDLRSRLIEYAQFLAC